MVLMSTNFEAVGGVRQKDGKVGEGRKVTGKGRRNGSSSLELELEQCEV